MLLLADCRRQGLAEIGKAFDGVVVVGGAGLEAEFEIHAMRGGHGGWGGVEIDGLAPGGERTVEDGLGEGAAEREPAGGGTNPEPLQLPAISFDGRGDSAPGDESCWLAVGVGDETAATLFNERKRQAGSFFFKRAEAEAGRAGLGDDEAAVFEQEIAGLGKRLFR